MKIQDLFARDISRSINGVVKADQLDASSVWQELDEFVVTRELTRHLGDMVSVLLSTMDSEADASGKNGIWVSGFFGCGKSHFIKVLSYVLENLEHGFQGKHRRAVEFFEDKIEDAMLLADLKKVASANTATILFNIDSKADHRLGRDALLQVFLKVLNEKQGFSSDHPHIAHMERHLEEKGKLAVFHSAFEHASGGSWVDNRDAWEFHRDEVLAALQEALGQSRDSVEKWVDSAAENFSLTVENFAKWVKRYLDSQGPDHRIMFLVDEVGQFIGGDTHLMLNLQTITEQLGTVCRGRAWVVVTSQEDLDAVLGDLKAAKQHDFSKIQGRFKTRLSLSSSNVDEVIKKRILDKREEALVPLAAAYEGKHDILRNQLSFVRAGMTFKQYADSDDFAACYPFAAYQFSLAQKVFESIRKAGATGLHLSQGERSTLDAFQSAAKQIGDQEIGVLVPFHRFYPSVEGFLDTAVKKTIDQADENHALKPFDGTVLRVLFLIRYIEEVPGSVDNLVTLCVDEIDADRLALRKQIEESLARLEAETLVSRNGDLYYFLTNEERDIGREIKNMPVASGAESRELGRILFEEILGDSRKHSYSRTGRDFSFSRICDDQVVGQKIEGSLEVAIATPLGDDYGLLCHDENCIMNTTVESGRVLVRLPDDESLGRELRVYLQTESYVKTKHTGSLPESTKRILRDRSDDNRGRRSRLVTLLKGLLADAGFFACGQRLEIRRSEPLGALGDALEYLIQNAFPKMGYIQRIHPNPKQEIQSILRANDVERQRLDLGGGEANVQALEDLRDHLRLCAQTSRQVVLHELIEKRYGGRPYGWPELEVVLLISRLAVLKEIHLAVNGAPLPLDQAYEHLTASNKQRKVVVSWRESAEDSLILEALDLGKTLFGEQGPRAEDALFSFLGERLQRWNRDLSQWEPLAKTGKYPGLTGIQSGQGALRPFVEEMDSIRFLKRFVQSRDELIELTEELHDLEGFYGHQKHSWEQLQNAVAVLSQNRLQLEAHEEAGPALARMEEILASPRPYGALAQAAQLIHVAEAVNTQLVSQAREPVQARIQGLLATLGQELDRVGADAGGKAASTAPLVKLLETAGEASSIAHISQAGLSAETAFDGAMAALESPPPAPGPGPGSTQPPAPKKRCVVEARTLCAEGFLETEAEVEAFLGKLREELIRAIAAGGRVQIK